MRKVYLKLYGINGKSEKLVAEPLAFEFGDLEKIIVRGGGQSKRTSRGIFAIPSDLKPYKEEYLKIEREGENLLITTPDQSLVESFRDKKHKNFRVLTVGQKARYEIKTYQGKNPLLEIEMRDLFYAEPST